MKPTSIARFFGLTLLGAIATSLPEKLVHADADASAVDAGTADASAKGSSRGGEAGAAHYTPGEGTVYDNRTRLTWQLEVAPDPVPWAQARDYCATLDLGGTGWRLPSVSELQTIVDETAVDPSIDLTAFAGTPIDYFWTSSVLPRFESFAWTVYFGYGLSTFFDVNQAHLVRCVK
jgi:hypothetical protein